jgi:cytidylate kinase
MFRVITIEREYGCGGAEIAASLAKRLGWKLWDHELTQEIAKLAHVDPSAVKRCDERIDSSFHRLAKIFWRGSYERSMPLGATQPFDTDRFVSIGKQVTEKAAREGNCVIVGRGAPYFLREFPDVFHVFLYASRAEKLRRLKAAGQGEEEATELVDTVDRDRMEFVKHYFNADWPTRCLYHVMINTVIGNEHVLATIESAMEILEGRPVRV